MLKEFCDYEKYRELLSLTLYKNKECLSLECLRGFTNELRAYLNENKLKLYRYSNADYFNLRNFETGKLRLTNNGILNDIFEGLPQGIEDHQVQALSDLIYMKCFSESCENILMWSHYADCNKGFCVEYDMGLISDDSILAHMFPVVYVENRGFQIENSKLNEIISEHQILNYDMINTGIDNYESLYETLLLFLFKGMVWKYEQEWRIIYTKAELYSCHSDAGFNQTIDFDCATGIYLGYRIDPEIKRNIEEVVERINIKRRQENREQITIYQAKLSKDKYELIFEKYNN